MPSVPALTIKLFVDGANLGEMRKHRNSGVASGFTTNPSLMRRAGVTDYAGFAKSVLAEITDLPISFEVFSDEFAQMEREARIIASWGGNVYVKIPVTNTRGESSAALIKRLASDGLQLNVTAIFTPEQVRTVAGALSPSAPSIVSVFAGRIADSGRDPMPIMRDAAEVLKANPRAELLWASTREILNVIEAQESGCHIITATDAILSRLSSLGRGLDAFSLETVKMFYEDARSAGYTL